MELPKCFYSKAFWVVIPLLSISMASSVMAVNEQIQTNIEYDYSQDIRINSIQTQLSDKIEKMYGNQMIICEKVGANCK